MVIEDKKMLFAFYPFEAHGHINPALSMANVLKQRGHDTVFLCINDIGYTDQRVICLRKLKEEREKKNISIVQKSIENNGLAHPEAQTTTNQVKISEADKNMIKRMNEVCLGTDPYVALRKIFRAFSDTFHEVCDIEWDSLLREVIVDLKPDVIIVDHGVLPAIMDPSYNQKWVRVCSTNPLLLYSQSKPDRFPAPYLGLKVNDITNEERELSWKQFNEARDPMKKFLIELLERANLEETHEGMLAPDSPHLNLYICPRELDYDQEHGGPLKKWHRIQSMNRPKKYQQLFNGNNADITADQLLNKLELPYDLSEFIKQTRKEGKKLVFMSLGTIACMDVEMMKRLVKLLARTQYKVIVAKGARHDQFDLAPNMWGAKYVPQKEILLLVDIVITHGGNNTITECLYSGVPGIIVCPMFCDQFDNATRLEEKHLGVEVKLGEVNSDELLLNSIDTILRDEVMRANIKRVSMELRQPDEGPEKAVDLLERLAMS